MGTLEHSATRQANADEGDLAIAWFEFFDEHSVSPFTIDHATAITHLRGGARKPIP